MIWRIVGTGRGRHEVIAESKTTGQRQSCGETTDTIPEIELFIFTHAKPGDMVCYPDGRGAKIAGMVLAA